MTVVGLGFLIVGLVLGVFAMLRDKDIAGVVRALNGRIDAWFVGGIAVPRGASATEVREAIAAVDAKAQVHASETPSQAFSRACESAGPDDIRIRRGIGPAAAGAGATEHI